jgi:hypothetical protein
MAPDPAHAPDHTCHHELGSVRSRHEMMPNFGLLRHSADKHRINMSPGCDLDGVFRLVSAVFRLAPPARFDSRSRLRRANRR